MSGVVVGIGADSSGYPQPLEGHFSTPICKDTAFATYLELTGSQDLLGTRRAVEVIGTLDGHPVAATLMPSGRGPHWRPLRAALCKMIGKDQAGTDVTVALLQRLT